MLIELNDNSVAHVVVIQQSALPAGESVDAAFLRHLSRSLDMEPQDIEMLSPVTEVEAYKMAYAELSKMFETEGLQGHVLDGAHGMLRVTRGTESQVRVVRVVKISMQKLKEKAQDAAKRAQEKADGEKEEGEVIDIFKNQKGAPS